MSGTRTDGGETDVWVRQTLCLRRIGDAWKIAHEHTSVPFYMDGSNKAALDLKP
jgi:ketosteroid isomerase-like protein